MHPEIPVGLATKLGAVGAGIAGLIAGVTAILDGDHTETTITGLLISGGLIYSVVSGRSKQAVAAIEGTPFQPVLSAPEIPSHSDEQLAAEGILPEDLPEAQR